MTQWNDPPQQQPASPWQPGPGQYGLGQPDAARPDTAQPSPGQPHAGQPFEAPQYGAQPYTEQPSAAPSYAAPSYTGQPGEVRAEYGAPPAPPEPETKKSRLPYLIAAAVCVVALVAAGLVFANARGWFTASGAASPNDAVQGLFDALAEDDLLGVVDRIAPAEAALTSGVTDEVLDQLKRLEIVKPGTTADQLYSLDITVDGLTLAPEPLPVNDHVQVVEVTGGTITVDSADTQSVLTEKIQDAAPEWTGSTPAHETFDIAEQSELTGGALRIATVQVDGRWYPSVFYTVADNIAFATLGPDYPHELSPMTAVGAATPALAMDGLLSALISGDVRNVAATFDPGTLGAVQDYASAIFGDGSACFLGGGNHSAGPGSCEPLGVSVMDAEWSTAEVSAGQKVMVDSLTLRTPEGDVAVVRDPAVPSLTITAPGEAPIVISPEKASEFVADLGSMFGVDAGQTPPEVTAIIEREVAELLQWGVTMVQGPDGQWYVSPIHSFTDLFLSLLRGLEPGDIDYLLAQGN